MAAAGVEPAVTTIEATVATIEAPMAAGIMTCMRGVPRRC